MEGENLFWTRTPRSKQNRITTNGAGLPEKMKVHSSFSASEKEIKRQKNPDAGFKITEQILSICLAHLILCCIEETVMDKVNPASPSGCVLAWTELRTVTHSRETHTHTHTHTHTVANIFFESFLLYASFLFFSWWVFCLEEHTIPGYGLPIRNRSLVPVPGEGSKARVREESWGSCSLRRTMSVHSWGEFDLMRICSTVPLRIQACRWRIYVLIYILRKFDECHSFFPVFSNQHLVWWGSKLPEKPWVMSELRCEWVTVWQW